jgi:hypothetical protein
MLINMHWKSEDYGEPSIMYDRVRARMDSLLKSQVDEKRRIKNRKASLKRLENSNRDQEAIKTADCIKVLKK